jgi:Zn-dependent membrane protease YugP
MISGFQMDPLYWLVIGPAMLLMLFAQWRIRATYNKWGQVRSSTPLEGAQVARRLLQSFGMSDVSVHATPGQLSDHYNPADNSLHLSESTVNRSSVASMAVVAHEVGHAQQDAANTLLMRLRSGIVPFVNLGSQLGPILFVVGLIASIDLVTWIGIALFALAFVFALLTLPVEIDASRRALDMLDESGLTADRRERRGARAVLQAAALTYLAGMVTALAQVIYYVLIALRGRRPAREGPN